MTILHYGFLIEKMIICVAVFKRNHILLRQQFLVILYMLYYDMF